MRQFWFVFLLLVSLRAVGDDCQHMPKDSLHSLNDIKPLADKFQQKKSINLNVYELKNWNQYAKQPCSGSFTATYKRYGKKITFIARNHITEPADPFTHKGLKELESIITNVKPDGILIETPTTNLMSIIEIEAIKKNCYGGTKFLCGEGPFAALVAHEKGALVQGGEPPPNTLENAALKRISRRDLQYYFASQTILNFKRRGLPPTQWEKAFDTENGIDPEDFDSSKLTFAKYRDFLKDELRLKPEQVNEQFLLITDYEQGNILQKVAFLVDHTREPFIVKSTQNLINRADNIVIVYSPIHHFIQANILKKFFGDPEIKCLK
jgi:hypothetical protein